MTSPDFWDGGNSWRMLEGSPRTLYHVDNGHGRAACMTGRRLGRHAPEDFEPSGGPITDRFGRTVYPAKAPVCMRCKNWLDVRGRWPHA